jgi:hypothetical protein
MPATPRAPWSIEDSADLYAVGAWGTGYFGINAAGHAVVRPSRDGNREIDLYEVVRELEARDLTAPLVLRFSDVLRDRLRSLHDAFAAAITENDYKNRYAAVYPIKVNQQRLVVEEVYRGSADLGFGLEAGSKPELLAVMALTGDAPQRLIVCNGFKDDSYIEAVILATKLGRNIIPVIENFSELGYILRHAEKVPGAPEDRRAGEARGGRRRALARVGGRPLEVRLVHNRDPRAGRGAPLARHARLPEARALPPGLAAARHPPRQGRGQRARRRVRRARKARRRSRVHRRRRRPRHRLRRLAHQFRVVDELFAARVRERRRLSHRQRLQRARDPAPRHHQRVGPRDRRAPQRAGVQRARRVQPRPLQRARAHGQRRPAAADRGPIRRLPDR